MPTALVIGASSGIGEALARRLVGAGWTVAGFARRASPLQAERSGPEAGPLGSMTRGRYHHIVADVRSPDYRGALTAALDRFDAVDACIYATGIGYELELPAFEREADVFTTNLVGAVITAELVLPRMIAKRAGHFIGLSSQADGLISPSAPSYSASKAGMSAYLEGVALACRPHGVAVTNVRFGFVDTAMSRGTRPFLISADRAAALVERCMVRRPIRYTFPWRMVPLVWLFGLGARLRVWLS